MNCDHIGHVWQIHSLTMGYAVVGCFRALWNANYFTPTPGLVCQAPTATIIEPSHFGRFTPYPDAGGSYAALFHR
jgi:hypothetical protein